MVLALQVLVILFGYLGAYAPKKKNIFIFYVISTIFSVLMFYSVKKYAAILPVATTGIRYFVFIFKDKYKTKYPLYICLLLHVIGMIISTKALVDIVPSAIVIAGCFVYWYLDEAKLKLGALLLNIPWIFYYIYCGLYLTMVNTIVQCILMGIAYFKLKKKETKRVKIHN